LGLNSDGTVQVPTNFHVQAGTRMATRLAKWVRPQFWDTSTPLAAGVFYKIVDMKVGQLVQVTLADHVSLKFKVIGLRQYSKGNFPDKLIYGPSTFSALD